MLRSTNITGAVSEALVVAYLSSKGYEVFLPAQPHARADLIYIDGSKPVRVQVKTATWHTCKGTANKFEQCRLVRQNGAKTPYDASEIDELWIVGTHLWRVPVDAILGKTNLSLGSTNPTPRKTVRDYNPDQYIVVHGSHQFRFRDRILFNESEPATFVTNERYAESTLRKMRHR